MGRIYEIGFIITTLLAVIAVGYLAPDFPGPYCATRSDRCCEHRLDSCSVPISTTLCYCDEFCVRNNSNNDCCPDYEEICLGLKPAPPLRLCDYKGQEYKKFEEFHDNCNVCRCSGDGVIICDNDPCMMDEDVVRNVNDQYGELGWSARNYSQFYGRKLSEGLDLRLGTKEPTFQIQRITVKKTIDLIPSFNARDHWPGLIADVRDQGWCGSSWAISTAGVASDRFSIQSNGTEHVKLAPQQFLSCVRNQLGCHGGRLDNAWNYFRKSGLVEEECYPYSAQKTKCHVKRSDTLDTIGCNLRRHVPRKSFYKVGPVYALRNETDIMTDIFIYGPVQATFKVYQDFFTYSNGIYRHSSATKSENFKHHSVRIIGWGVEREGWRERKYWICANSWGPWWGENGYFRIERGTNECDIEKYVFASWASEYQEPKNIRN